MMLPRVFLLGLVLAVTQDTDWTPARRDYAWSFPRDHWAHPSYKTEWWYITGNVADTQDSTRHFGYQLTFFRLGVLPRPPAFGADWSGQMLIMGHAAITDISARTHVFSDVLYRAVPPYGGFGTPGDALIAWSRAPEGAGERWSLRWIRGGFAFTAADRRRDLALDLATTPVKPLVFEGPNGWSRKGDAPNAASQYYSLTRLATDGTLRVGGRLYTVRGTSWMDQEIGSNQLAPEQVGWDWFGLQLDDGRELMLYILRDSTGGINRASGTLVAESGAVRYLESSDFTIRATASWRSDSTQTAYPARWTVAVPDARLAFDVVPLVADQENRAAVPRGLYYWEGAVEVRDAEHAIGRGYVELTGYGKGMKPAL